MSRQVKLLERPDKLQNRLVEGCADRSLKHITKY